MRDTPPDEFDQVRAAIEADLFRFERWMLFAIKRGGHNIEFDASNIYKRPIYRADDLNAAIQKIDRDESVGPNAKAAAQIAKFLPGLWRALRSNEPSWWFAQAMSKFASEIPTNRTANRVTTATKRRRGNLQSIETRREKAASRKTKAHVEAQKLVGLRERREWAGIVARKVGVTQRQARDYLKDFAEKRK